MQITSALSNLRSWLTYGNRSKWLVFFLFASTLFVKTMVFHWTTMHSILFSSLWKAPLAFFAFWGGKLVPVLFLSAFVFITKRQYWTIVINLLLDIWCIANLFYVKANGFFLTFDMIFMASNMDGFWSSLQAYMGWDIIVFPILTIFYGIIVIITKVHYNFVSRNYIISLCVLIVSLTIACTNNYLYQKISYDKYGKSHVGAFQDTLKVKAQFCLPFGLFYKDVIRAIWLEKGDWWVNGYIREYSIISYFPTMLLYEIHHIQKNTIISLSKEDESNIAQYIFPICTDKIDYSQKNNLIYILVESLESWGLSNFKDNIVAPYLSKLINSNQILYVDKIVSQVKHGNSADGQMIGMTGLLPISSGATCKLYKNNIYPNFAHMFHHSAIINPSKGTWEQTTTTKSYEFQDLIEPTHGISWRDEDVAHEILKYSFDKDTSFCVLGITITSHIPFIYGVENQKYTFEDMPQIMSAYLNCLHYTDSCIGVLVDSILNSPLASNTTIVITGDHTIFRDANTFSDMTEYAQANDINFQAGKTFTPLIIYSPNIQGNIHVTDTCYQMDIFPTILHLIGAEDYYWKGFGVNLLDSVARNNRPITEQEAFILSDKIIRANWFESVVNM